MQLDNRKDFRKAVVYIQNYINHGEKQATEVVSAKLKLSKTAEKAVCYCSGCGKRKTRIIDYNINAKGGGYGTFPWQFKGYKTSPLKMFKKYCWRKTL